MSKKRAIMLIIAAFLIGAILEGWIAARKTERSMLLLSKHYDSVSVKHYVNLLTLLRTNGDSKAIENLEMNLDQSLISLAHYMSNAPSSVLDPVALKYSQEAREYREQFPRKSGSTFTDRDVSNALLFLSSLTNK